MNTPPYAACIKSFPLGVCVCVSVVLVGQVMAMYVERTLILMHILTISSSAETTTAIRYSCLQLLPSPPFNSC